MSSLLAGILAALVLHLGTPFGLPWPGPVGAATTPGSMPSEAHIAVVDAGVTHLPPENEKRAVAPWTQLENRGSSADDTTVVFAIYDSSGNEVWSAWHGAVAWSERERKRLVVEWDTADVAPGAYRLTVSVVSDDQQRVFTTAENVARVQVRP